MHKERKLFQLNCARESICKDKTVNISTMECLNFRIQHMHPPNSNRQFTTQKL